MGAHSAGRRVVAPGRWRLLNRALETAAALILVVSVALAGWYTAEVTDPTPDPALAAPWTDENVLPGPGVPPVPRESLRSVTTAPTMTTVRPKKVDAQTTRAKKRMRKPANASATATATMSTTKRSCS